LNSGPTLLALDFDGTLAPIREDPAAVRMPRAARTLLREASRVRGLSIAIVSGRDADDIAGRTAGMTTYIVGSHGLEIRAPGGVLVRDAKAFAVTVPEELRRECEKANVRLERKKHAIALHWRGADIAECCDVIERFVMWARANRLETVEGRCVIEARVPGGGKEEAVRWLTRAIGAGRVIYAGDDVTDFGALRFAAGTGRGVFMRNSERNPPPGVTVVGSFLELFRLIRQELLI
jgi:trehalose-phosphatase